MASRYQRQKAARESERRKAEAAHEALLASFSSSFAGDGAGFVRGGDNGGGDGAVYKMAPPPAAQPPRAPAPALGAFFGRDGSPEPKRPPPKNRHIDAFLEELKGRQASGAPLAEAADAPGSFTDDGDRSTTNLYVGNVSPGVDEDRLRRHFEAYGPVASVKIMWPRSDDERRRGRNCGFVSFRERRDAADARGDLDGTALDGLRLSVGWGKALAARPDDRAPRAPAPRAARAPPAIS